MYKRQEFISMKRIVLLYVMLLVSVVGLRAQITFGQTNLPEETPSNVPDELSHTVRPFVKVGVVTSDYVGKYIGGVKSRWGWMAEAGLGIPLKNPSVSFQPSLRLISKGAKVPWNEKDRANSTVEQVCVEVPLNFFYTFPLPHHSQVSFGTGLFVSVGVAGDVTYQGQTAGTYGSGGLGLRRADVGIDIEMSFKYHKLIVSMGAETGFIPIHSDTREMSPFPRNRSFYLSAGVALW